MKKILFAAIFCLVFAANNLTCRAGLTRVADVGAENLYQAIQGNVQAYANRENISLVVAKLFRAPNADDTKYGLSGWACLYGLKTSSEPDGEILFSVNGEGYVSTLKVVSYSNSKKETVAIMIFSSLDALGLTPSEVKNLVENLEGKDNIFMSQVWSSAKNRNFLLMGVPRMQSDEGFQFLIMADDGRK